MLGSALEALRIVTLLVSPAMPATAAEIWRRIGSGRRTGRPPAARRRGLGRLPRGPAGREGCPPLPAAEALMPAAGIWFDSHCHLQERYLADGGGGR